MITYNRETLGLYLWGLMFSLMGFGGSLSGYYFELSDHDYFTSLIIWGVGSTIGLLFVLTGVNIDKIIEINKQAPLEMRPTPIQSKRDNKGRFRKKEIKRELDKKNIKTELKTTIRVNSV